MTKPEQPINSPESQPRRGRGRPAKTEPIIDSSKIIRMERRKAATEIATEKINQVRNRKKELLKEISADPEIEIENHQEGEIKREKPIIGRPDKLFKEAPVLNENDFLTKEGRYVDFTAATTLPELINLLREVGHITNSNGQTLEADTIIDLIHSYIYHKTKPDWTKITLRHRLREATFYLISNYTKTPEYLNNLSQVGFDNVANLNDLKAEVLKSSFWTLPNGLVVGNQKIVSLIDAGLINDLPEPIKHKVISLNRSSTSSSSEPSTKKNFFSRLKSWFK